MTKIVGRLFKLTLKEKAVVYHFHDQELMPIDIITWIGYNAHEDYEKIFYGNINITFYLLLRLEI